MTILETNLLKDKHENPCVPANQKFAKHDLPICVVDQSEQKKYEANRPRISE